MRTQNLTTIGLILALVLPACGSDSDAPNNPTNPTNPGAVAGTVTITAQGVSPASISVAAGSRVTFQNNDTRPHEPASDPHPTHGSCPPLDQVGTIQPNQSRTTGNLNTTGTCRYHDHLNDTNSSYNGAVTVQ